MIGLGLGKKLLSKVIVNQIGKHFKLGKILDYVEKPNDLDIGYKQLYKMVAKYGKSIEKLEVQVAILVKNSHPPITKPETLRNIKKELKHLKGQVVSLGDIISRKSF